MGLAKKGAKIAILDLDKDALATTKALVESAGSEARGYQRRFLMRRRSG